MVAITLRGRGHRARPRPPGRASLRTFEPASLQLSNDPQTSNIMQLVRWKFSSHRYIVFEQTLRGDTFGWSCLGATTWTYKTYTYAIASNNYA
eukprot:4934490-Pyramimonas_sp.AAC.1